VPLAVIEDIVDASGTAPLIEDLLPTGARGRQLSVRTLFTGMMAALADGRPAHLTRVLQALTSLPEADQKRLPDGAPSDQLQRACDQLLEASIPDQVKAASTSLAADWTDVEAWARPVAHDAAGTGADPEAGWGHRNVNLKIARGEMFYGYYSAATMVNDENGPAMPEMTRRITVTSSTHDPAAALADVLTSMPAAGVALGDVLADSGYSHRVPATWASPLRAAGAQLVQDLHPSDRGPRRTHDGAITANGNLFCPRTPPALLTLVPLPPGASPADTAAHHQQTADLARYKLSVHAAEDADGYRRHACPAAAGKIRCPLRPASMLLSKDQPEILTPPGHPPACCTQQTITAGPQTTEKTRQKHDYPSATWQQSCRRHTAAERLNAATRMRQRHLARERTAVVRCRPLALSSRSNDGQAILGQGRRRGVLPEAGRQGRPTALHGVLLGRQGSRTLGRNLPE